MISILGGKRKLRFDVCGVSEWVCICLHVYNTLHTHMHILLIPYMFTQPVNMRSYTAQRLREKS